MFRCTDCGQEYEIKPDYCDCGNNVFEDLNPIKTQPERPIQENIVSNTGEPQNAAMPEIVYKPKGNSLLQFLSVMIFVACLVLSVLSVIYIGKDSLAKLEQERKQIGNERSEQKTTSKLPSINEIWVENKNRSVKEENYPIENKVTVIYSAPEKKLQVEITKKEPPQTQKTSAVKTTKNTVPLATTAKKPTAQKTAQTAKTNSQTAAKTASSQKTAAPVKQQQAATAKQATTTQPVAAKPQAKQTTAVQEVAKPAVQAVNTEQLKAELYSYKIALRNKLSSNISFAQIVGDGSCAVTFRLDSTGNLIGRKFSRQSDNDSLNRVVYDAIIKNPTYNPPPAGYKGEILTFTVKMYGGHFTVTLN